MLFLLSAYRIYVRAASLPATADIWWMVSALKMSGTLWDVGKSGGSQMAQEQGTPAIQLFVSEKT